MVPARPFNVLQRVFLSSEAHDLSNHVSQLEETVARLKEELRMLEKDLAQHRYQTNLAIEANQLAFDRYDQAVWRLTHFEVKTMVSRLVSFLLPLGPP